MLRHLAFRALLALLLEVEGLPRANWKAFPRLVRLTKLRCRAEGSWQPAPALTVPLTATLTVPLTEHVTPVDNAAR